MSADTASPEVDLLEANDADFIAGFDKLYTQTWGEGAISAKYKELTGVTLSVVIRCEPCLSYHIKRPELARSGVAEHVQQLCGKLAAPRRCVGDGGRCTATRRPP